MKIVVANRFGCDFFKNHIKKRIAALFLSVRLLTFKMIRKKVPLDANSLPATIGHLKNLSETKKSF